MKYVPFNNTNMFLPDPLPAQITSGYYLPGDAKPSEISLANSWDTYKGYYFFLSNAIASGNTAALTDLQKKLSEEASLQKPLHAGACWLTNAGQGSFLQSVLQTDIAGTNVKVYSNTNLGFGVYQLPLFKDAPLSFQPAEGILSSGYPSVDGAQSASTEKGISLSVAGDQAGVLTGQVMINDFSSNEYTGWAAGFRYNMMSSTLLSQYYPLFDNTASTYWLFDVHWDPLHPLDSTRSYLTFTGISLGLEKTPGTQDRFQIIPQGNAMNSWLRTIYGQTVTLQPVTDGSDPAQLVFQLYGDPVKNPAYYLAPKGSFIMNATPDKNGVCQLLPGLSGTEAIQFAPGDEIIFYPDNAAYASGGLSDNDLDKKYTASWAYVKGKSAKPIIYSAAPTVASLYQPSATPGLLDSYYADTAHLPPSPANDKSFPLVPYAGLNKPQNYSFTTDQISQFESMLLTNARAKRMNSMPIPNTMVAPGNPITTTTPQGLLAVVDGLNWKEVLLAKNTELSVNFRFTNLSQTLRNAFQTDDLFLVISDSKNVGSFDHSLVIEGWQFNVDIPVRDPDHDPDQRNILILKFRKGAITDLITNTAEWTDPVSFNYDSDQVVSTQTWLIDYCSEAIELAKTNSQFGNFAKLVQDPEWNGILALRTDIDVGNFPSDLRGLLGAMDLKRFNAHHAGVQVNFVQKQTGQSLEVKKSNLFGLISYIDPAYQKNQGGDSGSSNGKLTFTALQNSVDDIAYAYKVLILQVVFENSALTNFNSKLELTARKWFQENGTLNVPGKESADAPANYSMIFNGRYENHDGHRTYTFLTQQDLTYQYFLTSSVLHYIEFVKAQFQTISSLKSKTVPDTDDIIARFTFYGYLNFHDQKDFDCFSYGAEQSEALTKARGLYFSNLSLDVTFSLNTKLYSTSNLAIALNPGNVSFDQSLSTQRDKSFAASFPISPNSILTGSGDNNPKKLGYLQVNPPKEFTSSGIQDLWYAINFDMHWGGPGALASQAGFIPQLMLAWSPGVDSVNVSIFIKMPGSGGGNSFSIQNVLKVSAGPFQLQKIVTGNDISYNFFLINLNLSLFGVKLPPMGNTNLVLIGSSEQPGTLGWYGAFINK